MTKKRHIPLLYACGLALLLVNPCAAADSDAKQGTSSIGMAVEFMDHAAAAFIARDKGWFEAAGLKVTSYECYATGMALAAALARGDIEAAYICLVPAINAYANAGVPIKVIAGTHKHGYGLAVNGQKIKTVEDLARPDLRLGCVREGGAVDVLMHRIFEAHHLDKEKLLKKVRRMSPAQQILAIQTGQLEAVFLPEQWATMAEAAGFTMLLTSRDVWPQLQGSVLVVKETLIRERPEVAEKLVAVLEQATDWINRNPEEAADAVTRQLQMINDKNSVGIDRESHTALTPEILLRSMNRLTYTTGIDPGEIQKTIDYLARLGYIKTKFAAEDILDLRFLKNDRVQ